MLSGIVTAGGVTFLKALAPVPFCGSQRKARPRLAAPTIWVGAVSLVGSVSTRSKENRSTLPVGSWATWTPKSGESKYSLKAPKSDAL